MSHDGRAAGQGNLEPAFARARFDTRDDGGPRRSAVCRVPTRVDWIDGVSHDVPPDLLDGPWPDSPRDLLLSAPPLPLQGMEEDLSPPSAAVPMLMSFTEACSYVVAYLKKAIPLASWSVNRVDGERQIHVSVEGGVYGERSGGSRAYSDSFCRHMVAGSTPQIAPDAMAVPQYATAGIAKVLPIGAYVGVPIRNGDGTLFGTLCGMDPAVQPRTLLGQAPLLRMLTALLEQTLYSDRLRVGALDQGAELRWSAMHDQLTGLPNRALFLDQLAKVLDPNHREPRPLVVLLDLDDFRAVNDGLGHAAGDQLLVRVADRLDSELRSNDFLARMGGDEFGLMMLDEPDPRAAAGRIVRVFQKPFDVDGRSVTVTASIGMTQVHLGTTRDDVDSVLADADAAMSSAKRGARGSFALYDPLMPQQETRDLQLRGPLRQAIATGAIEAVYQPIVELDGGRVIAFEALARWQHAGEMIAPDVFIPIAARDGTLSDLTDLMLSRACAQLARWSAELGHSRLQVGVNVPPTLISRVDFPARVAACVRQHGLAVGQLVLEITEEALLADPRAAREVIHQLHDVGATVALDDFGTGYSSLLHLKQIPLNSVKIDRGFVRDLDTNPASERFMRALLVLCRDLGLRVVVEGVERLAQAEVLHRLGCSHAQGYLFGHPARSEEIGELAPSGS